MGVSTSGTFMRQGLIFIRTNRFQLLFKGSFYRLFLLIYKWLLSLDFIIGLLSPAQTFNNIIKILIHHKKIL